MSTKRPISPRTPIVPNAPSEPSSSAKKARTGIAKSNGDVKLTAGARWMVDRLDEMQKYYAEAILAAASMMEYQTHAKSLGVVPTKVPTHMTQRMELAWEGYERTKRLVEWYMARNAEYASTPSKPPPLPEPTPARPKSPLLTFPQHLAIPDHPVASPIPLSSASFMINESQPPPVIIPTITPVHPIPTLGVTQPVSASIPQQPIIDITAFQDPIPSQPSDLFANIITPNANELDATNMGSGDADFGGLDLEELNAMINGQPFDLASMGGGAGGSTENGGADLAGLLGGVASGQSIVQPPQRQQVLNTSLGSGLQLGLATQRMFQAESVLDSLGDLAVPGTKVNPARAPNIPYQNSMPGQQQQPQQVQPQSLQQQQQQQLASLQQQHEQSQQRLQPQQSVDELFASLNAQPSSVQGVQATPIPVNTNAFALNFDQNTPTGLGLTSGPSVTQTPDQGDVDLSALAGLFAEQNNGFGTAGMGSGEQVGDAGLDGIDLDEYDFNDGMIGVDGDEFESLFAEFK